MTTRKINPVKVRKDELGIWWWWCMAETCESSRVSGTSIHWEVAQRYADEHVRDLHRPTKKISRETPTPPGGSHFDWSDTGMHLKVRK